MAKPRPDQVQLDQLSEEQRQHLFQVAFPRMLELKRIVRARLAQQQENRR